jgi:toxin ParE1/3/4
MNVVFRRRAVSDLRAIFAHIRKDNPKSAAAVTHRILEAIGVLADFPLLGRAGAVRATRELAIAGTPYIAVYKPLKSRVEIIAVFHGAQKRWR